MKIVTLCIKVTRTTTVRDKCERKCLKRCIHSIWATVFTAQPLQAQPHQTLMPLAGAPANAQYHNRRVSQRYTKVPTHPRPSMLPGLPRERNQARARAPRLLRKSPGGTISVAPYVMRRVGPVPPLFEDAPPPLPPIGPAPLPAAACPRPAYSLRFVYST